MTYTENIGQKISTIEWRRVEFIMSNKVIRRRQSNRAGPAGLALWRDNGIGAVTVIGVLHLRLSTVIGECQLRLD
ncbi:UNVERIFIED_ORG: hypothetical protein J2W65_003510 [Pseudomonas parafulva]|nr:hypothetical protein [Pseudomonas parafulva]